MVLHEQLFEIITGTIRKKLGAFGRTIGPDDPFIVPLRDDPVFGPLVRTIEEATGQDIEVVPEELARDVAEDRLTDRQLQSFVRRLEARDRGMTDFSTFVSIYAQKCGGGADEAAKIWNREKQDIKEMSPSEVRRNLRCP